MCVQDIMYSCPYWSGKHPGHKTVEGAEADDLSSQERSTEDCPLGILWRLAERTGKLAEVLPVSDQAKHTFDLVWKGHEFAWGWLWFDVEYERLH